MAPGQALSGCDLGCGVSDRVLLLLPNFVAFQQTVQFESQSLLHPKEIRKAKDDAEYDLADPADANESKSTAKGAARGTRSGRP